MSDGFLDGYFALFPRPQLSYGQCMDKLFDLWCVTNGGETFEEFIAGAPPETEKAP